MENKFYLKLIGRLCV